MRHFEMCSLCYISNFFLIPKAPPGFPTSELAELVKQTGVENLWQPHEEEEAALRAAGGPAPY